MNDDMAAKVTRQPSGIKLETEFRPLFGPTVRSEKWSDTVSVEVEAAAAQRRRSRGLAIR
jgi:hypothetical protein